MRTLKLLAVAIVACIFCLGVSFAAKGSQPVQIWATPEVYNPSEAEKVLQHLQFVKIPSVRMALADMGKNDPGIDSELDGFEKSIGDIIAKLKAGDESVLADAKRIRSRVQEILLSNPLLDFDRIMVVSRDLGDTARGAAGAYIGHPGLNSSTHFMARRNIVSEIAVLDQIRQGGRLTSIHKRPSTIVDIDVHWDGDRLLFACPDDINGDESSKNWAWQVYEINADGTGLKQVTPNLERVESFDPCYLPDGKIIFISTAPQQGVPCQYGRQGMAMMYRLDRQTGKIEQLTFEQDSDWNPTVLPSGHVMYLRWEYTDLSHYFSRILMTMNPDGTNQKSLYGSNSYFPNSYFYPKPIPGTGCYVGIVTGHHGISRSGRMIVVDPSISQFEAEGVTHEFPYRGRKVEPTIKDRLVDGVYPQFLEPIPLNDKYFLVSMKPSLKALWGIYLVDTFDNVTLIKEVEGQVLLEPVPIVKQDIPPVIPDRQIPGEKEASVFITNIYEGPGLKGLPKDKVKALRIFSYEYNYVGTGGHSSVGIESGWDVKRVLGTVPVEEDGSVTFKIPANVPVSLQPLDEDGAAVQLFRSWLVGKPGEGVSCVGCHEGIGVTPPPKAVIASRKAPVTIKPFYGGPRPFGFRVEVQPVLDTYCVSCHDGSKADRPNFAAKEELFIKRKRGKLRPQSKSYEALQKFVRRPGPESNNNLLNPMEWHVSTSELVQMLKKGHHGVRLSKQAWDKLYTWIDLNAPYRGTWTFGKNGDHQVSLRKQYASQFAGVDEDYIGEYARALAKVESEKIEPVKPLAKEPEHKLMSIAGWPLTDSAQSKKNIEVELGDGKKMRFAYVPAGTFVMGSANGYPDEGPLTKVTIEKPFWMGIYEVTNEQYALYDAKHDTGFVDRPGKDQTSKGTAVNGVTQPVSRVSWQQAKAFCKWLSDKTGRKMTLPTEAQWEWACRAGTDTDFSFGDVKNITKYANIADKMIWTKLRAQKYEGYVGPEVKKADYLDSEVTNFHYVPAMADMNDNSPVANNVGTYSPNKWGLYDMHGNVTEWIRSDYKPYPYVQGDGRNDMGIKEQKVARGGSWRDRPKRVTSSFRLPYESYQKVVNVGFRVIIEQ